MDVTQRRDTHPQLLHQGLVSGNDQAYDLDMTDESFRCFIDAPQMDDPVATSILQYMTEPLAFRKAYDEHVGITPDSCRRTPLRLTDVVSMQTGNYLGGDLMDAVLSSGHLASSATVFYLNPITYSLICQCVEDGRPDRAFDNLLMFIKDMPADTKTLVVPAHVRGNHWILGEATKDGDVRVYDSLYDDAKVTQELYSKVLTILKFTPTTFRTTAWRHVDTPACAPQGDFSCGINVIHNALQIVVGASVDDKPVEFVQLRQRCVLACIQYIRQTQRRSSREKASDPPTAVTRELDVGLPMREQQPEFIL